MKGKIFLLLVAGFLFSPFVASASTYTCGVTGGAVFGLNSSFLAHACKITITGSADISSITTRIMHTGSGGVYHVGVKASSGGLPTGSYLSSAIASIPTNGGCTDYSTTIPTTTLSAGTYWLIADTDGTGGSAWSCGDSTSPGTADFDTATWTASSYGYYFSYDVASSTSGGGGSNIQPNIGITLSGTTSAPIYDASNTLAMGIFIFLGTMALFAFYFAL